MLAIALNALWPLIAHAGPRNFVAEICSVNQPSALGQPNTAVPDFPQAPEKLAAAHCPFCAAGSAAALPALAIACSFLLPLEAEPDFPALAPAAPVPNCVLHAAAPPRAPPIS
jgi:hypothetical protein